MLSQNIVIKCPNGTISFPDNVFSKNKYLKNTLLDKSLLKLTDKHIFLPFDKHVVKLLIPYIREGKIVLRNNANKQELILLLKYISSDAKPLDISLQLIHSKMDKYGFKIVSNEFDFNKYPEITYFSQEGSIERHNYIIQIVINQIKNKFSNELKVKYNKKNNIDTNLNQSIWSILYGYIFANDKIHPYHDKYKFEEYVNNFLNKINFIVAKRKDVKKNINKYTKNDTDDNINTKTIFNNQDEQKYGLCQGEICIYSYNIFPSVVNISLISEENYELASVLSLLFDLPHNVTRRIADDIYEEIEDQLYVRYNYNHI